MLHIVKNLIVKRKTLLSGLVFGAAIMMLAVSAPAQCANWDASGEWRIIQRGQDVMIRFNLEQKGRVLTGTARHIFGRNLDIVMEGEVDGTIDGDNFSVQIFWPRNLTGVYNAKVLPSGRLDGETYDKNNSKNRQPWRSEGVLKCAPPVVAPPTPPKPIRSSGKMPKSQPSTPAPPKPPFITMGQLIIQPSLPLASVYLGWDGGPDHPNAEVLAVNEDGQTLMFKEVFKKPKGGIELRLRRGRQYMYVLKDAGVTLSTVNLVVP